MLRIDRLMEERLPSGMGVFLEIGANDGYSQSNTYHLERFRGWNGILIEPLPSLYRVCRLTRRKATCFNVACVGPDGPPEVEIVDRMLESVVLGQQDRAEEDDRLSSFSGIQISVPTMTLSACIDQSPFDSFTFMSVDVEGAEFSVLSGLDWDRHTPEWLLVETDHSERLAQSCPTMELVEQLTFHDYLLRRKSAL